MRLCTFQDAEGERIGVVLAEDGTTTVADIAAVDTSLPRDMRGLLAGGAPAREAAARAARQAPRLELAAVTLRPPVPNPAKFLGVGLNYEDHIREMNRPRPDFPDVFTKGHNTIVGPFDPVSRPRISDTLDYEGELGLVIGRRCRYVPAERFEDVLAGYVVVNDLTVREWFVPKTAIPTLCKGFDSTGPFGPWIVTPDELGDPHQLALRTWVNGELRQESTTANMIHRCDALIEILSQAMTLEPGDVITTGTPPGVGHGMRPPRYLQAGDRVRVEIERIGAIENPVVDEPAPPSLDEQAPRPAPD